jgi:hypothetical protein
MILNWKNTGVRGYHARVQIRERYCAAVAESGGPRKSIKIVNILIHDDHLQIGVREEDGAAYDWPVSVDPFAEGTTMVEDEGEPVMMACVEDWLSILSKSYYVCEATL